jgi:hypothetical protein
LFFSAALTRLPTREEEISRRCSRRHRKIIDGAVAAEPREQSAGAAC